MKWEHGRFKPEDADGNEIPLRLFLALVLPEGVKAELAKAQEEMFEAVPANAVRWTKPEQFHVTLKFLGNVEGVQFEGVLEESVTACREIKPFSLWSRGIGFFPDDHRPRVIWAGVHDEWKQLLKLQSSIDAMVTGPAGCRRSQQEHEFTGHVTLGRIPQITRSEADGLAKATADMKSRFFGGWLAESMELIHSDLLPEGPRYTTLAEIPFST